MTSGTSTDSVARLANLTKMQSTWIPADLLSRVSTDEPDYWGYQTCAEFGFYQTCEVGTQCMFAQGYDLLKDQVSMCTDEFKIPVSQVASNIELTNTVYGGNKPVGTCLTYPNGEVDPWHSLSILNATVPGITAMMVSLFTSHRPAKCCLVLFAEWGFLLSVDVTTAYYGVGGYARNTRAICYFGPYPFVC
jgi:hypothetical protein